MGKVYIVGAGCGALDLYTVKAMECIKNADCLIYDNLVNKDILKYCPENCEKIYVGKQASNHTMKQEDINKLLVEKSNQYKNTVRLKGGDVYVFGRGGEEAKELYENNIDFEVVPGLSSAIAGLCYAGIPITHRGLSGGFQVYTAQLKENSERIFDFKLMLDDYTTYVFLMGLAKLEMIVSGFLNAGKNPKTPVAIVSNASFSNQKCLTGNLENILDIFKNNPVESPAIIVVGEVVKMREYLNFYERKPLFNKNILVTTVGNDTFLTDKLQKLGASVSHIKTGEVIYKIADIKELKGIFVFTSKHGVIGFMKSFFAKYKDLRKLSQAKLICIGEKTNEVLNEYGLDADIIPSTPYSKCLNDEIKKKINEDLKNEFKNEKIYIVQGEHTPSIEIYNEVINVYENKLLPIPKDEKYYDYALFTCASSVKRFFENNKSKVGTFISIGNKTTERIKSLCPNANILQAISPSKDEMVQLILRSEQNVL